MCLAFFYVVYYIPSGLLFKALSSTYAVGYLRDPYPFYPLPLNEGNENICYRGFAPLGCPLIIQPWN
jgi:hypothetical protein